MMLFRENIYVKMLISLLTKKNQRPVEVGKTWNMFTANVQVREHSTQKKNDDIYICKFAKFF